MRPTFMCFILAVMAIHVVCAKPQQVFRTNYTTNSTTRSPVGVYSSPHGVNEGTSPFVMVNLETLQSFSASGKLLADTSHDIVHMASCVGCGIPLMNRDANNNTVFITFGLMSEVVCHVAHTLKVKWRFTPGNCRAYSCIIQALVYVEPELARCPSGAGGVSIFAGDNTSTINVVDIDTGALCGNVANFSSSFHFDDYESIQYQAFPSGGALKRPMFVVLHANTLYGIDAASGKLKYTEKLNYSSSRYALKLATGSSPTNEFFALAVTSTSTHIDAYIAFRAIANGTVRLQVPTPWWMEGISGSGWVGAAENQDFGAVAQNGWVRRDGVNRPGTVTVSAFLGAASFGQNTPNNSAPATVPMVNVDNVWTVNTCTTSTSTVREQYLYGFPVAGDGDDEFLTRLGTSPKGSYALVGAFAFKFENGAAGFGGYLWHDIDHELKHGVGVFTAYRV